MISVMFALPYLLKEAELQNLSVGFIKEKNECQLFGIEFVVKSVTLFP